MIKDAQDAQSHLKRINGNKGCDGFPRLKPEEQKELMRANKVLVSHMIELTCGMPVLGVPLTSVPFTPTGPSTASSRLHVRTIEGASTSHITVQDLGRCLRVLHESGSLRPAFKLVYFDPRAPHNWCIEARDSPCLRMVHSYVYEDGKWSQVSKRMFLQRVTKRLIRWLSTVLEDEDVQMDQMSLSPGLSQKNLEEVMRQLAEADGDTTCEKHSKYYDEIWCGLKEHKVREAVDAVGSVVAPPAVALPTAEEVAAAFLALVEAKRKAQQSSSVLHDDLGAYFQALTS